MATTDEILKTFSELTKETGKYAKELLDKGYDKAKTFAEVTKLNIELANRRRTLEKLYIELGKLYYANRAVGKSERLDAVCSKIDETKNELSELESAIEKYRSESQSSTKSESSQPHGENATSEKAENSEPQVIICTDCGEKNSTDDEFCVGCGRLLKKEDASDN